MNHILQRLNGDKTTIEALQGFMTLIIEEEALKLMYARQDTSHIADAHALLFSIFDQLEIRHGINQSTPTQENSAR